MTIEISEPEVEALILQRMESGAFSSPEDVILHALRASKPEARTGAALIAAMQASPHKEIEIEPSRGPMPVRDVCL
jgi:Arc/MetJ-type ribon-helix-helix transcriptional regulator